MIKKFVGMLLFVVNMSAAIIINNATNQTISVNVSNNAINRIVFPENIKDIAYSQEKGVNINISGNQAFIKFMPVKKNTYKQGEAKGKAVPIHSEIVYNKAQALDIYFITESKTYSFNLIPKQIDQQTIIVNDFSSSLKKTLKYETEDSYIQTLSKITKSILNDEVPNGYKLKEINKIIKKSFSQNIIMENLYEGVVFKAYLFKIKNNTSQTQNIDIKEFFNYVQEKPASIAVFYDNEYNELLAHDEAKVVFIFKANQ